MSLASFGKWILKILTLFKHRSSLASRAALGLGVASIVSGIATFVALTRADPFADKSFLILFLLYLDISLLLLLGSFIARRLVALWAQRRKGLAGSKLHIQLVGMFAVVVVIPAVVLLFSALFSHIGMNAWFGTPVKATVQEAHKVAEAYMVEHENSIKHDILAMVNELRPVRTLLANPEAFSQKLTALARERHLQEVLVFEDSPKYYKVIARSFLTFALEFENEKVLGQAFHQARLGEVAVVPNEAAEKVRALVRLDLPSNTYLYVGKNINPAVRRHLVQANGAVTAYNKLEQQRSAFQITFVLLFSMVALLMLLAAMWIGLTLANYLVRPISRLIRASEEVSRGNLQVQVQVETGATQNELQDLGIAFNHMIQQLYGQREELVEANAESESRRQFIESILASVSAGVISLDSDRNVILPNQRASELIGYNLMKGLGRPIGESIHEMDELLDEAVLLRESPSGEKRLNRQLSLVRHGAARLLQVCIVVEKGGGDNADAIKGFVITYDDVTPLMTAQRKAAWSDVARKIAHEIKNPLTPIQLSAERLKRRYLSEVSSDPASFEACVDTIIRQVRHIGKLVSEFSSFARMPEPSMMLENLAEICTQAVNLQKQAHGTISFSLALARDPFPFLCDGQQISQVLTNLLQNSVDSLTTFYNLGEILEGSVEVSPKGVPRVDMRLEVLEDHCEIVVEDNGAGFPAEGREKLLDPYYTTRAKGTGLGLAIVSKIVQDHQGQIFLESGSWGGAKVILRFPLPVK